MQFKLDERCRRCLAFFLMGLANSTTKESKPSAKDSSDPLGPKFPFIALVSLDG